MGITTPYPWYWGQDGTNPGSMVISTTQWLHAKSLNVVEQGNMFCNAAPAACNGTLIQVIFKHERQADLHIIVTCDGNVVNMGTPVVGSNGALEYTGVYAAATSHPTIALFLLAAGSSITFTQSSFPGQYLQFHGGNAA